MEVIERSRVLYLDSDISNQKVFYEKYSNLYDIECLDDIRYDNEKLVKKNTHVLVINQPGEKLRMGECLSIARVHPLATIVFVSTPNNAADLLTSINEGIIHFAYTGTVLDKAFNTLLRKVCMLSLQRLNTVNSDKPYNNLVQELTCKLEEASNTIDTFFIVFDNSINLLAYFDKEGRLLFANQSFLSFMGLSNQESGGRRFVDLPFLPNDDDSKELILDAIGYVVSGRKKFLMVSYVDASRGKHNIELKLSPVFDSSGNIKGIIHEGHDISEFYTLETILKQDQEIRKRLIDSLMDAYVFTNLNGKILDFNQIYVDMLGYNKEELWSMTFRDITPQKWHSLEQSIIEKQVLPLGYSDIYQKEYQHKNKTIIPVELRVFLLSDNDGEPQGMWAIVRDITERKKVEIELEKYKNHLEELVEVRTTESHQARVIAEQANKAKSEFLSNISHELRTPLNAIMGFSNLMLGHENLTSDQKKHMEIIYNCGDHLLVLINQILDINKIEQGKVQLSNESLNLYKLVNSVYDINKIKAAEKGLNFLIKNDIDELAYVHGDEGKTRQVLINIVNNALKFTNSGSVSVYASYSYDLGIFTFVVEDTGVGIPSDLQEKIFEPFFQYTGEQSFVEGIGLGLAISKKIVQIMQGNISLRSTPGIGKCFTLQIPMVPISITILEHNNLKKGYRGDRKRILVNENDLSISNMLNSYLNSIGFVVQQADSATNGLTSFYNFKPDLLIVNKMLPGINGSELVSLISGINSSINVKTIGISGNQKSETGDWDFGIVCDTYLSKPLDLELLSKTVGQLLQIEWEFSDTTEQDPQIPSKIKFPDDKVLTAILNYAEIGNYAAISKIITKLEKEEETFYLFCERIKKHLHLFDGEMIVEFINNH